MAKMWVLDTETKGTGANMIPLEKVERKPQPESRPAQGRKRAAQRRAAPDKRTIQHKERRSPPEEKRRTVSALPSGHVRKKATGEIGKVRSVDPKAGQAVVHWLKSGAVSTVPLSAISRR
jgi:hypothetical protein